MAILWRGEKRSAQGPTRGGGSAARLVSTESFIDPAVKDLLQTAQDRFKMSAEATAEIRRQALDDLRFRAGRQWPDEIERDRVENKRPCLTINRLPQFVRQITNDLRQNRPGITVSPVNSDADIDTAQVIQGLMRHIEYASKAEHAYDTAATCAVQSSFGYIRVLVDYDDPMSFDQEVRIKRVRNPFKVYFDPACQEPDYSDAMWAFITDDLMVDEYKRKYPRSKLATMTDWVAIGDSLADWVNKDGIRIAEYFYIEKVKKKLLKLSNGQIVWEEDMKTLPEGVVIIDQRMSWAQKVMWKLINGIEVLEETEWLGTWIPIIPVLGDEIDLDGEIILESAIRHAKDPQRMYNYWKSAGTEMIALAPKAPFVGAAGQFEGFEASWRLANTQNFPYLEYNQVDVNGEKAPPPERQTYEPPVQAITQAAAGSADDLKATTGIYDPALGEVGNETSGRAILARQNQSHNSNFHFSDNLSRAIRHIGEIVLELIPKVYDTARVIRIISETGDHSQVQINQEFIENGVKKLYDLTTGKYDIVISSGPSYHTKRQEAAASMQEVVSAYPKIMDAAGDLMVKNFDWPGAQEIAERLKKLLPPALQDSDQSSIPPQVRATMDQMHQLIGQLTEELHKSSQELENRAGEWASKERIAEMKSRVELAKTLATLEQKSGDSAFKMEIQHLEALLNAHVATQASADAAAAKAAAPQNTIAT